MFKYSAFSLTIESDLELPEFPGGSGKPDVLIRLGSVDSPASLATIDDEFAFPRHAGRFRIRSGRTIVVDPLPDADPSVIRTLLQGRMMACLLRQRGDLPLHASAIAIGGQCMLFLGESGAGKSTTAAAFHAAGHEVLTDDVAAVRIVDGVAILESAWPGLRLLDDARIAIRGSVASSGFAHDKYIYRLGRASASASLPVNRIYVLKYRESADSSVRTDVILPSLAVALLNSHSFLRPWRAGDDLRRINLARAAAIAAIVPVHHMIRPRGLAFLPDLVKLVEKDLSGNE